MPTIEDLRDVVRQTIDRASKDLRAISLDIHAHPELNFEEHHAHDVLTSYLDGQGFSVTRGAFDMPTAFQAVAGSGSPTIAVMCEYDALPEIGHACGHNLIAISGLATALALKEALGEGAGKVVVLGSPAEEGGGGKVYMVERGAFDGVDAAMMLHPSPGDSAWFNCLAIHTIEVEYFGRNAHASAAPGEGINALDALITAYNAISVLRLQFRPLDRVHGVITDGGVKPNITPDHSAGQFYVRARNMAELEDLKTKILNCFQAAALSTGCRLEYRWTGRSYSDLATNDTMANVYVDHVRGTGKTLPSKEVALRGPAGSTDMGNVSYALPSIHPMFAIPTTAGNHTPGFTEAAATVEAHEATLSAAQGLALTALDLYTDAALLASAAAEYKSKVVVAAAAK
jgi:amidohydrolase